MRLQGLLHSQTVVSLHTQKKTLKSYYIYFCVCMRAYTHKYLSKHMEVT